MLDVDRDNAALLLVQRKILPCMIKKRFSEYQPCQRVDPVLAVCHLLQLVHQLALLVIEGNSARYAKRDNGKIKRLDHIVDRSEAVRLADVLLGVFRRDHNDRQLGDPAPFVHHLKHIKTVFFRHHDIQQNNRNVIMQLFENVKSLFTVFCFQHLIVRLKHIGKHLAIDRRIIRDQHFSSCLPHRQNPLVDDFLKSR